MDELETIVGQARAGDHGAFAELVRRCQGMAYAISYAALGDFHLAQDAAQEAFIEAYRCLPALREAGAFRAWFRCIVRKHCDRMTRGGGARTCALDRAAEVASELPAPYEVVARHEIATKVRDAVRGLPEAQREATALYYLGGYTLAEVAELLGVPPKTVKSRLHSARTTLRVRMFEMLRDELGANPLPAGFADETVEQAVARAVAMREDHRLDEAEKLLRDIVARSPAHVGALTELNRTLMHGRVYGQARWDLLAELAARGREILSVCDEDPVWHDLAVTLMAIPVMPEAAAVLECWIERRGPDLERSGMLAWVRGCMGDHDAADAGWDELLRLASGLDGAQVAAHVPFAAYTLVDCFAASGEMQRAKRVAAEAWAACREAGRIRFEDRFPPDESGWLMLYRVAELDLAPVAAHLLAGLAGDNSPAAQGTALCIRAWIDEPSGLLPDWLAWMRDRALAGDASKPVSLARHSMTRALIARGLWRECNELSRATWELLGGIGTPAAAELRGNWEWNLDDPRGAIDAGAWDEAEALVARRRAAFGMAETAWQSVWIAAKAGRPTPPEIVAAAEEGGVQAVDTYGLYGWYMVAREAAAVRDEPRAVHALREALARWCNPPLTLAELCDGDTYWGDMRKSPAIRAALDEKRARIGPVHGQLHYFPGW